MAKTIESHLQNSLIGQTVKACYWLGNFDGTYGPQLITKGSVARVKTYAPNGVLTDIFTPEWRESKIAYVSSLATLNEFVIYFENGFAMICSLSDELEFITN